jgi:hypothetical protein
LNQVLDAETKEEVGRGRGSAPVIAHTMAFPRNGIIHILLAKS